MFSEKLKVLRKSKGLTQEQLSNLLNVQRSSVGKYESSNVIPSPEVLKKIADIFNVTTDYLLGKTDVKESPIITNAEILKLWQAYQKAPEEVKNIVDMILRGNK